MHAPHIHKPETSSSSSQLLRAVARKALVVMTSEYCTTKTCNGCRKLQMKLMHRGVRVLLHGQEEKISVKIMKKWIRDVQHCGKCKITVNRDLNAAKNIAHNLLLQCMAPSFPTLQTVPMLQGVHILQENAVTL